MKKMAKIMMVVLALTAMFSTVAFAANQSHMYAFSYNSEDLDSPTNVKPNDGDYKCYVTTLASYDGVTSNVFSNGGTFYARARLYSNPSSYYSPLFTFTSNTAKTTTYGSGMARFGSNYILRAEIDRTNFTGYAMYQSVRWCP